MSMQFLRGYSSDSEEEHTNEGSKRKAEDTWEISKRSVPKTSPSSEPFESADQPAPSSTQLPLPLDPQSFVTYSEEYSQNMHKKSSAFLYLPWSPTADVQKRLRMASDRAVDILRATVPNFEKRFSWNHSTKTKTVLHGKYGHTNKNAINSLHVTLFPNILGPKHQMRQLTDNLRRAVKNIEVPPELKVSEGTRLDSMMGVKKLRFEMRPELTCFLSSKTGVLFIGMRVKKYVEATKYNNANSVAGGEFALDATAAEKQNTRDDTSKRTLSPEQIYLHQLALSIGEQADQLNFQYDWTQISKHPSILTNQSIMDFHASLMLCELKPLAKPLIPEELSRIREALLKIPTQNLQNLALETHQMLLDSRDKNGLSAVNLL